MKTLKQQFLTILLTSILSVAGVFAYQYWNNQTKYIRYKITNTGNILEKIRDKADLQIEKQTIKSLGVIECQVFNTTGTTLKTLDVLITLNRKDAKGKLVNWDFTDVEGEKNRVTLNKIDSADNFFNFYLTIDPYNKSDKPVLFGTIIVSDIELIEPRLTTAVEGFEPSKIDEETGEFNGVSYGVFFIAITILAFFSLFLVWAIVKIKDSYDKELAGKKIYIAHLLETLKKLNENLAKP